MKTPFTIQGPNIKTVEDYTSPDVVGTELSSTDTDGYPFL